MVAIVSVETVLLVLLLVLVAGLLRSHAEIMRRLGPADVRVVIVTHGSDRELPAKLRSLAPAGIRS